MEIQIGFAGAVEECNQTLAGQVTPAMQLVTESWIEEVFEGFDRDRVFNLTNGQKWQQAVHGYTCHYLHRPVARVWSDGASYYLEVEGVDGKVLVRRA